MILCFSEIIKGLLHLLRHIRYIHTGRDKQPQESERPLAAVAVMVAFPGLSAERLPSWSTETTPGSEEAQKTDLSVASSGEMVAIKVSVPP